MTSPRLAEINMAIKPQEAKDDLQAKVQKLVEDAVS
jgi:hypothetical protein